MCNFYVGITIGPIVETLCLASRPASLWCASSMFSWLTENICNQIIDKAEKIISPYYPKKKNLSEYSVEKDGVGKYHDRIIFSIKSTSEDELVELLDNIIKTAKENLAERFISTEIDFGYDIKPIIVDYLQIRYIIEKAENEQAKNCILRLSPYLDAVEICPTFSIDQSEQPILTLFEGENTDKRNEFLKKCFGIKNSALYNEQKNTIKDVESIASSDKDSDRKIFDYYAIVQADGDNFGNYIKSMITDGCVSEFSDKCLQYTTIASDLIKKFGAVPIYAGGDDLLFISPLESENKETIFNLCAKIRKEFAGLFGKDKNSPTVSFGISINYKNFPLYEAFKDALDMLYVAKEVKNKEEPKNKTAVHIRKHSGQSIKFRFTNDSIIDKELSNLINENEDSDILKSILYKIDLYRTILIGSLSNNSNMEEVFKNLFDSEYHKKVDTYINTIRCTLDKLYKYILELENIPNFAIEEIFDTKISNSEDYQKEKISIELLYNILRVSKFYSEKRGKNNGISY